MSLVYRQKNASEKSNRISYMSYKEKEKSN